MSNTEKTLYYLNELPDYKVADGDCDVRGWDVQDKEGHTIGKVDGLLVDKSAERVVYLDVEVDKNLVQQSTQTGLASPDKGVYQFLHKDGDNHLIIPVGMVQLDEENETVCASEIDYDTFAKAGRFSKGVRIEREYERTLMRHYRPGASVDNLSAIDESFYTGREFEHTLGRRKG